MTHNYFFYTFISILYTFRSTPFPSSEESIVSIVSMHQSCDIYQKLYWYNWFSWWWALCCSKRVENWNKRIRKKNCASSWLFTRIIKCYLNRNVTSQFTGLNSVPNTTRDERMWEFLKIFFDTTKHWIQLQNDSSATAILCDTARTVLSRDMTHETQSTCIWKKREMPRKNLCGISQKNRPPKRHRHRSEDGINISLSLETLCVKRRAGLK